MEKPINLLIMNMKQDILKVINSEKYNLPIIVKQMIMNDVKQIVDTITENILNQEIKQYENSLREINENKENKSE